MPGCLFLPSSVTSGAYSSGRLSRNTGHLQVQETCTSSVSQVHVLAHDQPLEAHDKPTALHPHCSAAVVTQAKEFTHSSACGSEGKNLTIALLVLWQRALLPCSVGPACIQVEGVCHKALHGWWCWVHVAVLQLLWLDTNLQDSNSSTRSHARGPLRTHSASISACGNLC